MGVRGGFEGKSPVIVRYRTCRWPSPKSLLIPSRLPPPDLHALLRPLPPRQRLHRPQALAAGLARRRAARGLRRRHRRGRRAWALDRALSRQGAWRRQCRGDREGLDRLRQCRAQHDDRALELSAAGQHPALRAFAEAVGGAGAGPELQRDGQPARRAEPLPYRCAARRLCPARQCDAAARRRRRTARPGRRARHGALPRFRQRALSDPGRAVAAARRHGPARRGRLGLCQGGERARGRHRAELRGDRFPHRARQDRRRRDCARVHQGEESRHRRSPAAPRASPRWRVCGCRSKAMCCRPSSPRA